jgi:cardiolipin synthase
MDNKEVWKFKISDLFTIPNIITYIRFLLIIPFLYYFLTDNYLPAAICIGFSGLSDCFDGFLARKLNQVTSLGKILDPIADKFTLLAVVVCMVILVPVLLPVLIVLLVKDVLMLLGGTDLINKGLTPPAAKWYGKVGTVAFYFSVCIIVFLKAVFNYENIALDITLLSVTAITMLFALYQYGKIYFQMIKEYNENLNNAKKDNNN